MLEQAVKEFYGKIKFPGYYTIEDLLFYDQLLSNKFLLQYDNKIKGDERILDIGCGSGFICNLIAHRHPEVTIDAVDFSDSIDYAKAFSQAHDIRNIRYFKEDFLTWIADNQYDCIMSNGVIHHMEQHNQAFTKIDCLLKPNGLAVIGIYNPFGKLAKKIIDIKYRSELLYLDQEHAPYETAFTDSQMRSLFNNYQLESVYPSIGNHLVDLRNLFNYHNGGLTVYQFRKYED